MRWSNGYLAAAALLALPLPAPCQVLQDHCLSLRVARIRRHAVCPGGDGMGRAFLRGDRLGRGIGASWIRCDRAGRKEKAQQEKTKTAIERMIASLGRVEKQIETARLHLKEDSDSK